MPQVYADKIGSKLGKKPDANMRIKTWVGDGSLVHMRIKILLPGSNQDLTPRQVVTTDAKPPTPFKLLNHCCVVSNSYSEYLSFLKSHLLRFTSHFAGLLSARKMPKHSFFESISSLLSHQLILFLCNVAYRYK